jgi:hypothetical protein
MIQHPIGGLAEFLRVVDVSPNTWKQRVHNGETALGFGFAKPVNVNDYGAIDVVATLAVRYITGFVKIDMKVTAALLRDDKVWPNFLEGIAVAEREKEGLPRSEQVHIVIGTSKDKQKAVLAVGTFQAAIDEIAAPNVYLNVLPLRLVIRDAYQRAKAAKVEFPKVLTPDLPGTEAFTKWLERIEEHRREADMKAKVKKRAKAIA